MNHTTLRIKKYIAQGCSNEYKGTIRFIPPYKKYVAFRKTLLKTIEL